MHVLGSIVVENPEQLISMALLIMKMSADGLFIIFSTLCSSKTVLYPGWIHAIFIIEDILDRWVKTYLCILYKIGKGSTLSDVIPDKLPAFFIILFRKLMMLYLCYNQTVVFLCCWRWLKFTGLVNGWCLHRSSSWT
jgi:hypothetical protein